MDFGEIFARDKNIIVIIWGRESDVIQVMRNVLIFSRD